MTGFDALRTLFGSYLNIDWDYEYPDLWSGVADFIQSNPELRTQVCSEITILLTEAPDEKTLEHRLSYRDLDLGYYPINDDVTTYRQWLGILSERYTEMLAAQLEREAIEDANRPPAPPPPDPHEVAESFATLLHNYLGDGWSDRHPDAQRATEAFVREQPELASLLPVALEQLLTAHRSESEMREDLIQLGLVYRPSSDGFYSYRNWLLTLEDRVTALVKRSTTKLDRPA